MLLKANRSVRKSKGKLKNTFRQINENENTTIQNLWDASKSVLRRKFMVTQDFLKKEKSQINNLTYHLKELEKTKPKVSRRKEIIKIREEINKIVKKQ